MIHIAIRPAEIAIEEAEASDLMGFIELREGHPLPRRAERIVYGSRLGPVSATVEQVEYNLLIGQVVLHVRDFLRHEHR